MKKIIQIPLLIILFVACQNKQKNKGELKLPKEVTLNTTIQDKISNLKNSHNKEIIVVAHRADWRNAPENSLQGIENCIRMGVDMVEIDVRETKDGELVLMHDRTIDRTTNGKGLVKEWTLDSLKTLKLLDGLRVPTSHKIPTLREALLLTKDNILVNLDKSYEIFDKCFKVIKNTDTQDQVIIKGAKRKDSVIKEFSDYLDKVHFMPIVGLDDSSSKSIIDEYIYANPPVAIEFIIKQDTLKGIDRFVKLREQGVSIWVNSLWSQLNGGHDDEKAVIDHSVYDWYIDNNIDIIQTDRPVLLLKYLRSKGLHD